VSEERAPYRLALPLRLELGACLDGDNPAGSPSPSLYPFGLARTEARDAKDWYQYVSQLTYEGVALATVLDTESVPSLTTAGAISLAYAEQCASRFWIILNELDIPETAMPPEEYARWWYVIGTAILTHDPNARLVVAGMASGDPSKAKPFIDAVLAVGPKPYALDVHLYPSAGDDVAGLLAGYAELGLPLTCFEWNPMNSGIAIAAFVAILRAAGVIASTYFEWSDGMVPGYGLIDVNGKQTPEYAELISAAGEEPVTETPTFEFGFADYAAAHPEVGAPLEDEGPIGDVQLTENGVLLYFPRANQVKFIPFVDSALPAS